MFEFLFKRSNPQTPATPTPTPVNSVNHVSVDEVVKGILDDGSTCDLLVICITEQDPFGIGGVAYATMRTRAIISQTVFTLEDSNGLYHVGGEQFLQWTRPCQNGVWA